MWNTKSGAVLALKVFPQEVRERAIVKQFRIVSPAGETERLMSLYLSALEAKYEHHLHSLGPNAAIPVIELNMVREWWGMSPLPDNLEKEKE